LEYGTKKYAPIKGTDPLSITLDEAVALVEAKIVTEAEKIIKVFKDTGVKILKGRWGPYITDEATKKNAKIKKDEDPLSLSFEECVKRLEEAPEPKKRGRSAAKSKKAPAKKSATKKAPAKKSAPKKAPAKKTVKA